MGRVIRICATCVLTFLLLSCSHTANTDGGAYAKTIQTASEVGTALVGEGGDVTAVSIAIMSEGALIYSRGFGSREIESQSPVDAHTRFNIGSITKVFTAILTLMLQEDGLLDLDDRVADLMERFSPSDERARDVTVRMLLDHQSGLSGTDMNDAFSTAPSPLYAERALKALADVPLKHDPGAFNPYCNDGFTVAQILLEELSGKSFAQLLQERIFEPLGMHASSVGFYPDEENVAQSYIDRSIKLSREYVNLAASGGITSTAEDLLRFATVLFAPDLLNEASLSEYCSPQYPRYADQMPYEPFPSFGLGWDFTSMQPYAEQGIQVLGKTGGTLAYTTMLLVLPQSQSAVVLLSSGHIDPVGATLPIVDALLRETGQISSDPPPQQKKEPPSSLPSDIDRYSGYWGNAEGLVQITFDHEASVMHQAIWDGTSFVPQKVLFAVGEAMFEDQSGLLYTFTVLQGFDVLLRIHTPYNQASIAMTKLSLPPRAIEHEFSDGSWLAVNHSSGDFTIDAFTTATIEDLGQILLLNGIPYAIRTERETAMMLPALRDQSPPRLDKEGYLRVASYRLIKTTDIPPLRRGELITIEGDGISTWRTIEKGQRYECSVPLGGRIVILDSEMQTVDDTLFSQQRQVTVEGGAYIAFMADRAVSFEPQSVTGH